MIIGIISDNSLLPLTQDDFYSGNGVFGSERDLELVVTSGPSGAVFTAGVNNGDLSNSSPYQGSAFTVYQLDGIDASSQIKENGLGNFDLTFSGTANGLVLVGFSDVTTIAECFIYTASGRATFVLSIPGNFIEHEYVIEYSSFSGNADFSDVGAIEIKFNGDQDVDVQFSFFGVVRV